MVNTLIRAPLSLPFLMSDNLDAPEVAIVDERIAANKISKAQSLKTTQLINGAIDYVDKCSSSSAFVLLHTGRVPASRAYACCFGDAFAAVGEAARRSFCALAKCLIDKTNPRHADSVRMLEQLDSGKQLDSSPSCMRLDDDTTPGFFEYAVRESIVVPAQALALQTAWSAYQRQQAVSSSKQNAGNRQRGACGQQAVRGAPSLPADTPPPPPDVPTVAAMQGQHAPGVTMQTAMQQVEETGAGAMQQVEETGALQAAMQQAEVYPLEAGAHAQQVSLLPAEELLDVAYEALHMYGMLGHEGVLPKSRRRARTSQNRFGKAPLSFFLCMYPSFILSTRPADPDARAVEESDEDERHHQSKRPRGRPPGALASHFCITQSHSYQC